MGQHFHSQTWNCTHSSLSVISMERHCLGLLRRWLSLSVNISRTSSHNYTFSLCVFDKVMQRVAESREHLTPAAATWQIYYDSVFAQDNHLSHYWTITDDYSVLRGSWISSSAWWRDSWKVMPAVYGGKCWDVSKVSAAALSSASTSYSSNYVLHLDKDGRLAGERLIKKELMQQNTRLFSPQCGLSSKNILFPWCSSFRIIFLDFKKAPNEPHADPKTVSCRRHWLEVETSGSFFISIYARWDSRFIHITYNQNN